MFNLLILEPTKCFLQVKYLFYSIKLEEWGSVRGHTKRRSETRHNTSSGRCRFSWYCTWKDQSASGIHERKTEDYGKYYAYAEIVAFAQDWSEIVETPMKHV